MRLPDKIAIVTGSANGIGLATVRKFSREGAVAIVVDVDPVRVAAVVEGIEAKGGRARGYPLDITDRGAVRAMVADVVDRFGRIDVLVNNAGITRDARLAKMTEDQFDVVIAVNLKGTFTCAQAVTEAMVAQGSGAIVNVSSISGTYGNFGQTNYAAAKAGVVGMTKTWARELGPKNVRVNAVVPGPVATSILDTVPAEVLEGIAGSVWLRRIGQPEEVANVIAFLASDEASFVNGAALEVSGGVSV